MSLTPLSMQTLEFASGFLQLVCMVGWHGGGLHELLSRCEGNMCCCKQTAGPAEDTLCLTAPVESEERGQVFNALTN